MPALKSFAPSAALTLHAKAASTNGQLRLSFQLRGDLGTVVFSNELNPARRDELWKHTCFEAFVQPLGGDAYFEINLTSAGEWNVYAFDKYREGMRPETRVTALQNFSFKRSAAEALLDCAIDLDGLGLSASGFRLGLTAVIESAQGEKSYWSLHHPAAKPDFHDQKGFQLELAPAIRN